MTVGNVDDTFTGETLAPVQFGEAGIDLTLAGIDVCSLNGVVTGVSRSSGDAGTAQMKDKVGPEPLTLPGCTQETTITSAISLDDHATINGFDSTFTGDHTGSLTFQLLKPGVACSGTEPAAADVVYHTTIANVASGDNSGATNGWSTADGDNAVHAYVVPHTAAAQAGNHRIQQ